MVVASNRKTLIDMMECVGAGFEIKGPV